jgi:DNA topoisomerase-1
VRTREGFDYVDAKGRQVRDARTLRRIRDLVIPPAWETVWISPAANGHIQATGRDARGRKQYRYHARWRATRDESKFVHMAAFGRALPLIRQRVEHDLRRPGLSRDKVLATVVRLLEQTLIRVGNDQYARENHSFGLTTLRGRHVHADGAKLYLEFKGKSGVRRRAGIADRRLARTIRRLQDLPGQHLFQYVDAAGERHAVGSSDVNAYLREITGAHVTAKDFRTWAGTLAAAKALALQPPPASAAEAKRLTSLCVKATAGLLGNTPAVCRAAYIHPAVLAAFAESGLPQGFARADGEALEAELLEFLDALAAASA